MILVKPKNAMFMVETRTDFKTFKLVKKKVLSHFLILMGPINLHYKYHSRMIIVQIIVEPHSTSIHSSFFLLLHTLVCVCNCKKAKILSLK